MVVSLGTRGTGASSVALGHITVWKTTSPPWYTGADAAYDGDHSVRRIRDLAMYENVPFTFLGPFDEDASYQMGPYPIDTFMTIERR